jgi:hypothetical protein
VMVVIAATLHTVGADLFGRGIIMDIFLHRIIIAYEML